MRFIDEHRDRYAVALLLRVLDITASTYYGWLAQAEQPCEREVVDGPGYRRSGRSNCGAA